jgi:hypothetical protein
MTASGEVTVVTTVSPEPATPDDDGAELATGLGVVPGEEVGARTLDAWSDAEHPVMIRPLVRVRNRRRVMLITT